MNFQEKLKSIQKYADVTQTQLAAMLDVSFPTLNSWINNRSEPRKKALEKIDSLYIEYVGNLDIDVSSLNPKRVKLDILQKAYNTIPNKLFHNLNPMPYYTYGIFHSSGTPSYVG